MPNRYTRDQLIKIALEQVQLPNLEIHEMPDGAVLPSAFSIQWLQDIIDFWHHMVPFSATVTSTTLNCTINQDTVTLPSDFIIDVRDGYLAERIPGNSRTKARTKRLPFQAFLNRKLHYQNTQNILYPGYYCVIDRDATTNRQKMLVAPTPTVNVNGTLWYYQLPSMLTADQMPVVPNDYVCIQYLKIRMLEFVGKYEPGTAQKFCDKLMASCKAAGLLNEPEDNELPFDTTNYSKGPDYQTGYAWMGPV